MASKRKPPLPKDPNVAGNFPVLVDLPSNIYEGIGKIVAAHALLENCISETLFDLLKIDYPEGRVAFAYRAASAQFDIVKRLIDLHGIKVPFNLKALDDNIEAACTARDQFAHGIWIERSGLPALRLTKGTYPTQEGTRSRATLPQAVLVPPATYDNQRLATLEIVKVVQELQVAIRAALQALPDKSGEQS